MNNYSDDARVLSAFCDENRLRILELLRSGEKCACKLLEELSIGQSTMSHHMKVLCEAGVVTPRKEGKWTHYKLNTDMADGVAERVRSILTEDEPTPEREKTELYLITGFLGSGKTTRLLKILDELAGERVGVIQNEFGKLSVDGERISGGDIVVTELSRGSIFCSCLKLSFVQALAEMAGRRLGYVFVESSGLGDPSNIAEILEAAKLLCGDRYEFRGAICLVDAVNFLNQLGDLETVERQLKHCHLALLTKTDIADMAQIERVKAEIRRINPVCPIAEQLDSDFLKKDLLQYSWAEGENSTNTEEAKPKTLSIWFDSPVNREELKQFILQLACDAYRIKGTVQLEGEGWSRLDLVGARVDLEPCMASDRSHMVVISKIGPAIIKKIAASWGEYVNIKMEMKN